MEREQVKIKSGIEFDPYFPVAHLSTITQKKGATVKDTIRFIPKVVHETLSQTKQLATTVLQASTIYKTCENIWHFVYQHIAYKKDEEGKEQVRSPSRTWHDRKQGVDCDCYSTFISSILTNLNIKHVLRITKYGKAHFQHIYPIVPIGNGKYITIDCVVNQFNYEEPFTEKKDTNMDLEYLNGVAVSDRSHYKNNESENLMSRISERDAMMELGKLFKRKTKEQRQERRAKIKKVIGKGFHVANKLNPATAAIRAGILAAMKLNFMKIGSELKYTYLSDEEAKRRGIAMDKFSKMKSIREKLEKIFYGSGGKPENLKKAILTGKGNKNKDVPLSGLEGISYHEMDGLHEQLTLQQLLGNEMMDSEGINGLDGLGEPATAATVGAATTVLTTIVALIKKVGSLIPKKKIETNEDKASNETTATTSDTNTETNSSSNSSTAIDTKELPNQENASSTNSENDTTETNEGKPTKRMATQESTDAPKNKTSALKSFWDQHKKWLKPTGIGVVSLGLLGLAYQFFRPSAGAKSDSKKGLSGLPKIKNINPKTRKKKHKTKHKTKQHRGITKEKLPIELL